MVDTISEAEEYDLFGFPDSTIQDCDFMEAMINTWLPEAQKVLDIACGTGRHAIEMGKRGYAVTGIDISPSMLDLGNKKTLDNRLKVSFTRKDMLSLNDIEEFDVIYILFNTLMCLIKNDDLVRFMKGVHASLRTDGMFILEVVNYWGDIARHRIANTIIRREDERGGVRRVWNSEIVIGPNNNIIECRDEKHFWKNGIEMTPKTEVNYLRAFSYNELKLLCQLTDFQIVFILRKSLDDKKAI